MIKILGKKVRAVLTGSALGLSTLAISAWLPRTSGLPGDTTIWLAILLLSMGIYVFGRVRRNLLGWPVSHVHYIGTVRIAGKYLLVSQGTRYEEPVCLAVCLLGIVMVALLSRNSSQLAASGAITFSVGLMALIGGALYLVQDVLRVSGKWPFIIGILSVSLTGGPIAVEAYGLFGSIPQIKGNNLPLHMEDAS